MLIDIHTHAALYQIIPHRNGFYFITPEELVGIMDQNGVDMAVVLPASGGCSGWTVCVSLNGTAGLTTALPSESSHC